MALISSFFNGKTYNASDWANYFAGFLGTGVLSTPGNNLQVSAGTGLSVIINSGIAYINGYYFNNTEPFTLTLPTPNSSYPTIISIVLELDLNATNFQLLAIPGIPASDPIPPQMTQTTGVYQLQLATVQLQAGASTTGQIIDTRGNEQVCGWCQANVTSTPNVQEINTALNGYFFGNQTALNNVWVTDFNTLFLNGIYSYHNDTPNQPSGSGWGVVIVYVGDNAGNSIQYTNGNNSWIWQVAYDTNGQIYWRNAVNGNGFGTWVSVAQTESPTLNNPTLTGTVTCPGTTNISGTMQINGQLIANKPIVICEENGEINFLNSQGAESVTVGTEGDTTAVINTVTGNNIIEVTPVTSGTDTLVIPANVQMTAQTTISGSISLGGYTNINNTAYVRSGGSIIYAIPDVQGLISKVNGGTYSLTNLETGTALYDVTPVASGADTINVNANVNLAGGLNVNGNAFINTFENLNGTFDLSATCTATYSSNFWYLNGGLVSNPNSTLALGILETQISVSENISFQAVDNVMITLNQIPQILGSPINTFSFGNQVVWNASDPAFSTSVENSSLLFSFASGGTLQSGINYTAYALVIQN